MTWTYEQASGKLYRSDGSLFGTGYSGADDGKNQPDLDSVKNVGPIPRGLWRIGPPFSSMTHGSYCLPLAAMPGTVTHGRGGFLCHGDSIHAPGTASQGCIIMPHAVREELWASGDRILEVVAKIPMKEVA